MKENPSAMIFSASSDIGGAMCRRWLARGWNIFGTYRTMSHAVAELQSFGIKLVCCNLSDQASIHNACSSLQELCPKWDLLAMCPGTQDPIGAFIECGFDEWEESVGINFISQMRIIHELLPSRHLNSPLGPCVLLLAGGGTNSAPVNYSSYIISKIALIKMSELLDAEILDTRFVILGPGWVKTKIHKATLKAGEEFAGANYERTIHKLTSDECTPMEEVMDCCEWLINQPREVIGGRNFSAVFDRWGSQELVDRLGKNFDMYKLRRHGNELLMRRK